MKRIIRRCAAKARGRVVTWALNLCQKRLLETQARIRATDPQTLNDVLRGSRLETIANTFEKLPKSEAWRQEVRDWLSSLMSSKVIDPGSALKRLRGFEQDIRAYAFVAFQLDWELERALRIVARQQRRIAMPPGRWIGWFARTFLTLKTQDRVIEPLIADYRHEVYEAIIRRQAFRERYLKLIYGVKFVQITIGAWITGLLRLLLRGPNEMV